MKKDNIRTIVVLAAIFVAWQVIAFAPPFVKNGTFWVSYVFADFAILAQGFILHNAFADGVAVKSKVYGFPIARLGVIYLFAQLTVSLICLILALWVPVWAAVLVDVLLLAAAVAGLSAADAVRQEIQKQDVKTEQSVSVIRKLQAVTAALAKESGSDAVVHLAESLRYSDPVSSEALTESEEELKAQAAELEEAVSGNDSARIRSVCAAMEQTLAARNALCKLNKR